MISRTYCPFEEGGARVDVVLGDVDLEKIVWRSPEDMARAAQSLVRGVQPFVRAGLKFDPASLNPKARLLTSDELLLYVVLPGGHEVSTSVPRESWEWKK